MNSKGRRALKRELKRLGIDPDTVLHTAANAQVTKSELNIPSKSDFSIKRLFKLDIFGLVVAILIALTIFVLQTEWIENGPVLAQVGIIGIFVLCVIKLIFITLESKPQKLRHYIIAVICCIALIVTSFYSIAFVERRKHLPPTVKMTRPEIEWPTPNPIEAGTPLSLNQLNAKSSVKGEFSYNPNFGATLQPGVATLSTDFIPDDPSRYSTAHRTVSIKVNDFPTVSPSKSDLPSLKRRTEDLAQALIDFVYAREGPINAWKQQAYAQAFITAIDQDPSESDRSKQKLLDWNKQTQEQFAELYWPKVLVLESDLRAAGVDTALIQKSIHTSGPRKTGFMLSVLADRIGKRPPFSRTLTTLEAKSIMRGLGGVGMEVYAYDRDPNSKVIGERLRAEFEREGWNVNKKLLTLNPKGKVPLGVNIVFPSGDLEFNFEGMIAAIEACELDQHVEVRPMKQPPTILKIEVWPDNPASPSYYSYPADQLIVSKRKGN